MKHAPGGDEHDVFDRALGRAINHLGRRTAGMKNPDLQEIAGVVVSEGRAIVRDVQCVLAVLADPEATTFTVIAGAGPWAEDKVGRSWPTAGTLNGRALLTQETVETADAPASSSVPAVFDEAGAIRVGRLVPILGSEPLPDGRHVLGVLGFWRATARFTDVERERIDAFSTHAALHLVASEARRTRAVTRERLAIAHRVSLDLQASLDPTDVVARLLRTSVSLVTADRATLSTIAHGVVTIEATLGAGGEPTWVGRSYGDEFFSIQPHVGRAVSERRPVLGGRLDVANAAPEFRAALAGVKHTLTLPLIISDHTVGLMVLSRFQGEPFTAGDIDVMQLIGNIAALALRNARQHEAVNQAARAKSDFLNMAAHELRTPITVVQGYLDLIRQGAFGPPAEEFVNPLRTVANKAQELGSLVNNILDAARLPGERPVLPFTVFDLDNEVVAAIARAEARRALLAATLIHEPPELPVRVEGRREYVERILDNMINNALTYQDERPWVRVSVSGGGAGAAVVSVEDRGLGVPPEFQESIFEQFFRIAEPPWDQTAGTGLGLYLGRQLAQATGGSLALAESTPGVRTVFTLTLPAAGS